MKKTWIWILVCALLVAVLPLSAGAQAPAGEPVASAEELAAMEPDGTYYLSADVTVTGEWQYAEFKGTLDGNGHTVYLDGATLSGGLFTVLNGATVKNLSVQALSEATFILPSNVDSYGVIAARAIGNNTVENVVAQVNILQMETTVKDVGGLVGNLRAGSLTLRNCVYAGVIGSGRSGYGNYVGGILGSTWNGAVNLSITNCVTYGAYSGQNHCGGVIGGIQQGEDKGVTNLTLQYNVNYANVVNTGGAEMPAASSATAALRTEEAHAFSTTSTTGMWRTPPRTARSGASAATSSSVEPRPTTRFPATSITAT